MSRQQFTSRNNIGQVLTLQKSGSTASFDPTVSGLTAGTRRVSWRLDNGSETIQTAGNSITYTGFTSDPNIRTIQMRGNSFSGITNFNLSNDNLYGQLDLTSLSELGGDFRVNNNLKLTGITHSPSSQIFTHYFAFGCQGLTGNLDLTPLSGLGGDFRVGSCGSLTGITHSPSSQNFSRYYANNCNLTGNLDLTLLSGLGGDFQAQINPNLTGITHSPSSQNFSTYHAYNCNLTGNLDLTPLSGLGGDFRLQSNSGLTSITHSVSSQNFTYYWVPLCNLTGTLDLSPLTKLGGPIAGSVGSVILITNPNLTDIKFPNSTQFFRNSASVSGSRCFSLQTCNLGYVDFTPLSGATLLSGASTGIAGIELQNNNMSTTEVNHILVDFSGNATFNPTGWSNINLNIGGTNGAPDASSGGYNGIDARNFLTGSPYNWTITHS